MRWRARFCARAVRRGYRNVLTPLLDYLRSVGVVPERLAQVETAPAAQLLGGYRPLLLLGERKLGADTVEGYEEVAADSWTTVPNGAELSSVTAEQRVRAHRSAGDVGAGRPGTL